MSNAINNSKLANTVSVNLKTPGAPETTATKISQSISTLESQLIALYSEPIILDEKMSEMDKQKVLSEREGKISSLQTLYQRAMRVYEGFQTLMKNMHEMMMRGIQNLRMG